MIPVTLPQLSLAMEEGKVMRWLVANGERVAAGQAIVEIETDKAVTEVEAPAAGMIRLIVAEGASVAVETTLAEIDAAGVADQPVRAAPSVAATPARPGSSSEPTAAAVAAIEPTAARRHRASPAARRVARERGIEVSRAHGTGPGGRITVQDLAEISATPKPALREAVVAQLAASWREIPHIHIAGELDGGGLASAKQAVKAGVTVTDLLIYAVAAALPTVPELNGTLGKPADRVHLALAVATPNGVIAPVIRNANELSLAEIVHERSRLVTAARAGGSDRRDLAGATFTLTNLGAYPVDFFAPVVSGPQIAMLATGRLAEKPVAAGGQVTIRHRIWANVAIDHRGGDGVSGARFLAALEHCMNDLPNRISARR